MANWIGVARSNYFKVKDREAFLKDMEDFPGLRIVEQDGRFALFGEEGYWPSNRMVLRDDGETEDTEVEWTSVIAAHLPEDEAAVFTVAGFEKERYVTGYAFAVNSEDEVLEISIDNIYEIVQDTWGIRPTVALY